MDFVEALPKVHGKSVILTVVDRFSKYAHFIPLGHPYTASSVARAFFHDIVRLHGFPESIVSDRDPVFTGNVWRDLFRRAGVQLRMSTAFHPQTDGQSEAVNKTIAMYLRCITGDRPRDWLDWLLWVEYCYNTAFHSALRTTPFTVVYGRPPPALLPMRWAPRARTPSTPYCPAATSFSRRYALACSRRKSTPVGTTTLIIAHWSSPWVSGCGFGCYIALPSHLFPAAAASLDPSMLGPIKCWSASARWPAGSSCRRVHVYMLCSMWES